MEAGHHSTDHDCGWYFSLPYSGANDYLSPSRGFSGGTDPAHSMTANEGVGSLILQRPSSLTPPAWWILTGPAFALDATWLAVKRGER